MSHVRMSHVPNVKVSCPTCERVCMCVFVCVSFVWVDGLVYLRRGSKFMAHM